jgi:hypothetical protein
MQHRFALFVVQLVEEIHVCVGRVDYIVREVAGSRAAVREILNRSSRLAATL